MAVILPKIRTETKPDFGAQRTKLRINTKKYFFKFYTYAYHIQTKIPKTKGKNLKRRKKNTYL